MTSTVSTLKAFIFLLNRIFFLFYFFKIFFFFYFFLQRDVVIGQGEMALIKRGGLD